MHSVRSIKATYVAAFVFGVLLALLIAAPARSEEASRLDQGSPSHDERLQRIK